MSTSPQRHCVPTARRYVNAAIIAGHLATKAPERCGCTMEQRDDIVCRYRAVLDRQEWCDAVHANTDPDFVSWLTATVAARLDLRAFR
jgi:hypothetical protein